VPLRSDWSSSGCPIARSLDVVGDPWVLLILREAMVGIRRYDGFRSALGIADNVLSRRLAGMVEAGLLERVPYRDERRTRYEYQLTDAGRDLLPVLHALVLWGNAHTASPHGGQLEIVHRACGQVSGSADTCTRCGVPVGVADIDWHRPWRTPATTPLAG
jgi:DNA-binding HxlR family transcriptional regulator